MWPKRQCWFIVILWLEQSESWPPSGNVLFGMSILNEISVNVMPTNLIFYIIACTYVSEQHWHDYLPQCIRIQVVHFNQLLHKRVMATGTSQMQRGAVMMVLQMSTELILKYIIYLTTKEKCKLHTYSLMNCVKHCSHSFLRCTMS